MRVWFLALFFFLGCSSAATTNAEDAPFRYDAKTVTIGTARGAVSVDVELADTDDKRGYGLMNRKSLPENAGMLFVFNDEAARSFWMKDTPLSLDMIFIATGGEIVYIARGTTPFSAVPVSPRPPAKFVLEVNAGWSERHGVNVGDKMTF